jgi:hypothetical protein
MVRRRSSRLMMRLVVGGRMSEGRCSGTIYSDRVIVGGGIAALGILEGLSRTTEAGKVLAIDVADRWATAFPRKHLLGQSRHGLSLYPQVEFNDPNGMMSAEEHVREIIALQVAAVERLRGEDVDGLQAKVLKVSKTEVGYLLECESHHNVSCETVFLATGVGPERTLQRSGVQFSNQAGPSRSKHNEITTALRSLDEREGYWFRKRVVIFGGGATAAWIAERVLACDPEELFWIARDFGSANPAGRNSKVMGLTAASRIVGTINELEYQGALDASPPDDGLVLTIQDGASHRRLLTDFVICATGADPWAPGGVRSVLGSIYENLKITSSGGGVFAHTPDWSLFVVSSALTDDQRARTEIRERSFAVLSPEHHVMAGAAVTKLSADSAVSAWVQHNGGRSK